MEYFLHSRYRILLAIILCYLLPILALNFYNAFQNPISSVWIQTFLSLFLASLGTLALFIIITSWESELTEVNTPEIAPEPLVPMPTINPELLVEAEERYRLSQEELSTAKMNSLLIEEQLNQKNSELLNLTKESEKLTRQIEQTRREFEQFKISSEEKLEQNHLFLGEYQQTINEQRNAVELKQQMIEQLETKVRDLTYEIKTLLQLAEKVQFDKPQTVVAIPLSSLAVGETLAPYHTYEERQPPQQKIDRPDSISSATAGQLKRCLDIAQKITGGSHYANRLSRSRDLPIDNNALDLRRLCDSLRSEATNALWVYSQKENKLLFANQEIKNLLGWHPEKFCQNFMEIVDQQEWQAALAQLAYKNDCQSKLLLKTRNSPPISLQCHMGVIPTGLFRGHIIGIAQP